LIAFVTGCRCRSVADGLPRRSVRIKARHTRADTGHRHLSAVIVGSRRVSFLTADNVGRYEPTPLDKRRPYMSACVPRLPVTCRPSVTARGTRANIDGRHLSGRVSSHRLTQTNTNQHEPTSPDVVDRHGDPTTVKKLNGREYLFIVSCLSLSLQNVICYSLYYVGWRVTLTAS